MAFYDMAGGQRFTNAPAMVQAGIEDGRKLREIALFNQHGQGIMNGDAAAMVAHPGARRPVERLRYSALGSELPHQHEHKKLLFLLSLHPQIRLLYCRRFLLRF